MESVRHNPVQRTLCSLRVAVDYGAFPVRGRQPDGERLTTTAWRQRADAQHPPVAGSCIRRARPGHRVPSALRQGDLGDGQRTPVRAVPAACPARGTHTPAPTTPAANAAVADARCWWTEAVQRRNRQAESPSAQNPFRAPIRSQSRTPCSAPCRHRTLQWPSGCGPEAQLEKVPGCPKDAATRQYPLPVSLLVGIAFSRGTGLAAMVLCLCPR